MSKILNPKLEIRSTKQYQMTEIKIFKTKKLSCFEHLRIGILNLFRISIFGFRILIN